MKKSNLYSLFLGLLLGFSACFFLRSTYKEKEQPVSFSYPQSVFTLKRSGYTLSYDGRTKGAIWVYERLTPDQATTIIADRKGIDFCEDFDIPSVLRATKENFRGSGYDRGHLCPAIDVRYSNQAMRESFILSNISPQCPNLNRGLWGQLEQQINRSAASGKVMHIFTLPLYLPKEIDGERCVHYRVIGESDVAVPTHFAKVSVAEGEEPLAYIFPNEPLPNGSKIEQFKTTLEKVERAAGVVFFSNSNKTANDKSVDLSDV
jgi:endonuclease G